MEEKKRILFVCLVYFNNFTGVNQPGVYYNRTIDDRKFAYTTIYKMEEKKRILFVCLGNTCRSPIAEGVFQKRVNELGQGELWEVDSAGLKDWHEGDRPNYRSLEVMKNKKVPYNYESRSRPITSADFEYFDYIIGMDSSIMSSLRRMAPATSTAQLLLFGDFDPQGQKEMMDPYGDRSYQVFENCYEHCLRCATGFLKAIISA